MCRVYSLRKVSTLLERYVNGLSPYISLTAWSHSSSFLNSTSFRWCMICVPQVDKTPWNIIIWLRMNNCRPSQTPRESRDLIRGQLLSKMEIRLKYLCIIGPLLSRLMKLDFIRKFVTDFLASMKNLLIRYYEFISAMCSSSSENDPIPDC